MANKNISKKEEIEPTTDLSPTDILKIEEFMEKGLPGLAAVTESNLSRIMDLYLSGKSYTQISAVLNVKRIIVTYLSHKFDWYQIRRDFFREMEATIKVRLLEEKIKSQDFLLTLTHFWQLKIGKKVNKFLATGVESDGDKIDLKEVDKYYKAVEILHKLDTPKKGDNDKPSIGLNVGDGMNIKKISETEVEITPKAQAHSLMLKKFADSRRGHQNQPKPEESEFQNSLEKEKEENENE